jgi:hypothetical protein
MDTTDHRVVLGRRPIRLARLTLTVAIVPLLLSACFPIGRELAVVNATQANLVVGATDDLGTRRYFGAKPGQTVVVDQFGLETKVGPATIDIYDASCATHEEVKLPSSFSFDEGGTVTIKPDGTGMKVHRLAESRISDSFPTCEEASDAVSG